MRAAPPEEVKAALGYRGMTQTTPSRPKLGPQQVAYAGEHYVAAEVHNRGGYAVTFSGNMKGIDLLASDVQHERVVKIQVKSKTRGTWQTTIRHGREWPQAPKVVDRYWVFVDLGDVAPKFYIVPAWWIENDIDKAHQQYLDEHGGHRAKKDESPHHAMQLSRIVQWKDKWETMKIGLFTGD